MDGCIIVLLRRLSWAPFARERRSLCPLCLSHVEQRSFESCMFWRSFSPCTQLPSYASAVGDDVDVYAIPIQFRQGGMLLALPHDIVAGPTLLEGQEGSEETLFGPNSLFTVGLLEEAEDLSTVALGVESQVCVVDVKDEILAFCREYDPVTDSTAAILGFSSDFPNSLPDTARLWPLVKEWLAAQSEERTGFYTAQEDLGTPGQKTTPSPQPKKAQAAKRVSNAMIAEQLSVLTNQMKLLADRQDRLEQLKHASVEPAPGHQGGPSAKLPAVSAGLANPSGISQTLAAKALNLVGPPPRTRAAVDAGVVEDVVADEPYDPLQPGESAGGIVHAIAQQSSAITALVAHLASQSGDVVGDLSSLAQSSSSTKGVQRREKMQNELAAGTSNYFTQLLQQVHRRLNPSKPVPQNEEDLQTVSVLTYLERQGGYRNNRELGLVAWILGHAIDAAASGNVKHTKEILALLMVAVEQAVVDRGDWGLAYMLTLMEEPPLQMFQDRTFTLAQHSKPFSPLVPPAWTAVCLAYLKDLEVLATKKTETSKRTTKPTSPADSSAAAAAEPDSEVSPRRKPRFPKKPKAKGEPKA